MRSVAVTLLRVHGASGEHPDAAHEARLRRALTSSSSSALPPPRSRITLAACRGSAGGPVFSSSPGPGRSSLRGARIG